MANAADFVRLALALPDVVEYPNFDRRAFKARITFATLAPDGASANLKFSPNEQEFKCLLAPEAFAPIANAWGPQGLDPRDARGAQRRRTASRTGDGVRPCANEKAKMTPAKLGCPVKAMPAASRF